MKPRDVFVLRHNDYDRNETIGVFTSLLAAMSAASHGGYYDGTWSGSYEHWYNIPEDGLPRRYPLIIERMVLNKVPAPIG